MGNKKKKATSEYKHDYKLSVYVRTYAEFPLISFWERFRGSFPEIANDEYLQQVLKSDPYIQTGEYYKTYGLPGFDTNECCFQCWKSSERKCKWSDKFKPVDGWVAKPTMISMDGKQPRLTPSFKIYYCPEFERDRPAGTRRPMDREGAYRLLCAWVSDMSSDYRNAVKQVKRYREEYYEDPHNQSDKDFIREYGYALQKIERIESILSAHVDKLREYEEFYDHPLDDKIRELLPKIALEG